MEHSWRVGGGSPCNCPGLCQAQNSSVLVLPSHISSEQESIGVFFFQLLPFHFYFSGTRHGPLCWSLAQAGHSAPCWKAGKEKRCTSPRAAGSRRDTNTGRREYTDMGETRCPPVVNQRRQEWAPEGEVIRAEWPQPVPSLRRLTERRFLAVKGGLEGEG